MNMTTTLRSKTKRALHSLTLFGLTAFACNAAHAETVTFGVQPGNENTWYDFGIRDETDTGTAGLNLTNVQDGITFILNLVSTAASGGELQLKSTDGDGSPLVPATGGNVWEDGDGTLIFELSVTDPLALLETIEAGNIDISGWGAADEDMAFTAFGATVTNDPTAGGVSAGVIDYDTLGLPQLSTNNIDTWSLEIDMVDTGAVGGLDSISFNYTLGGNWTIPALSAGTVTNIHESGSVIMDLSFSKPVTGLNTSDFIVTNAVIDSLTGSGSAYQLTVSPTTPGGNTLNVTLPQSTTTPQNLASAPVTLNIVSNTPVPTISAGSTEVAENTNIAATVSFDIPVSGLSLGEISVLRGRVQSLSGYNNSYTITVSPTGDPGEIIEIRLPADVTVPANAESGVLQIGITSDGSSSSGIQLSDIYGNDMVFQRDQVIPITGTAFPGEIVTVAFKSQLTNTTVAADGAWLVHLNPEPASPNSDQLVISGSISPSRTIRARVGEVWMCAGQSNMADSFDNPPPALEAEYQDWVSGGAFNHFYFSSRGDGWKRIEVDNRNVISRTAFYFGMELYRTLNPDTNNIAVPVGVIISANGGTPIQSWMPAEDAEEIRLELGIQENWNDWENKSYRFPGAQWEDKMDHIPPHSVRGVVWYQGERNAKSETGYEYDLLLEHHVETWRRIWAERGGLAVTNFPFFYVEVSHRHARTDYEFPWLRDRLRRAMDIIPNAYMAHFYDGGPDLHPANKQLAGQRLALQARKRIHGETGLIAHGPLLDTVTTVGNTLVLTFTEVNGGLRSLTDPSGGTLDYFDIAGEDGVYTSATATIVGDTVVVSNAAVADPVHVRYLFQVPPTQSAPDYSLENVEGIPAATIISDDDFMPIGRTGGLTAAQYNDKLKAEALDYLWGLQQDGGTRHLQYSYTHDDTVDQVSIRFYVTDDLMSNWVEVATSDITYDGAPPSNTDEGTHGNWIHSVGGSSNDRYRAVIIRDPDPVGTHDNRFYRFNITP